jgi:Leucine-rich repeat (LRR) protein
MPLTDPNPIQLLPKLVALGIDNCNISTINFANFPILNTLLLHECKELKTLVG